MSLATEAVHSPDMAKQEAPSKQINIRLPGDFVDVMEAYRDSQPWNPSWTRLVEVALREWMAKHAPTHKLPPKRK